MSTILITGANRGIALALSEIYLARDNNTVIATARSPAKAAALQAAPRGKNTKLVVVHYEAGSRTAAKDLIDQVTAKGITNIDVLVSSAGTGDYWGKVLDTPAEKMEEFFRVNTLANVLLYQAAYPLLEKSKKPIFAFLSSSIASTTAVEKVPFLGAAYGGSKAWVNHIIKRISIENPNIIPFAIHPGWVQTEMGNGAGAAHGIGNASITVDVSAEGLANEIDTATKEKTAGKFLNYDGTSWDW